MQLSRVKETIKTASEMLIAVHVQCTRPESPKRKTLHKLVKAYYQDLKHLS